MNRKARILLVILGTMVTVLAILLVFRSQGGSDVFELPGIGDGAQIDRITLGGSSGESIIVRSDGVWRFETPAGALADPAGVSALLALFSAPVRSDIHSDIGGDPDAFGFDAPARVTLGSGDSPVVDVEIGLVQTFADRAPDTFVRVPGAGMAFRVTGRDLRAPLAGGKFALRSRRFFPFAASEVAGLEFMNPGAADPRDRIIRLAVASRPPPAGGVASPAMSRDWVVVEPPGVMPGRLNVLAARIAGLVVESWAESLPAGVSGGGDSPSVRVRTTGGATITAAVYMSGDGFAWVSSDQGIARMREADAGILVRSIADVRDPVAMPFSREEIESVRVEAPDSSYVVTRRGGRFSVSGARPIELDRASVESWFASLAGLSAERTVRATDATVPGAGKRALIVTLRDGSSRTVRFGVPDREGLVPAVVDGDPDFFMFPPATVDAVVPELDGLRRRNVFGGTPDELRAIVVSLPDGRRARFVPPGKAGDQWTLKGGDGRNESSQAITTLAGAAMSMSASGFVADPPASVGADAGTIEFIGRGARVVVRVSSRLLNGSIVCAVSGDPAFSRQAFLLPSAVVQGLLALAGRGSP